MYPHCSHVVPTPINPALALLFVWFFASDLSLSFPTSEPDEPRAPPSRFFLGPALFFLLPTPLHLFRVPGIFCSHLEGPYALLLCDYFFVAK